MCLEGKKINVASNLKRMQFVAWKTAAMAL